MRTWPIIKLAEPEFRNFRLVEPTSAKGLGQGVATAEISA